MRYESDYSAASVDRYLIPVIFTMINPSRVERAKPVRVTARCAERRSRYRGTDFTEGKARILILINITVERK